MHHRTGKTKIKTFCYYLLVRIESDRKGVMLCGAYFGWVWVN